MDLNKNVNNNLRIYNLRHPLAKPVRKQAKMLLTEVNLLMKNSKRNILARKNSMIPDPTKHIPSDQSLLHPDQEFRLIQTYFDGGSISR